MRGLALRLKGCRRRADVPPMHHDPPALPAQPTFQVLTLRAFREIGGRAERFAIRRRAVVGDFATPQLAIPASPPSAVSTRR